MKRCGWVAAALASTALAPMGARAAAVLPTGGRVVSGVASIGGASGGSLTITQSTSKAIIDWNGFSIGSGGKVGFANGTGATLNRVTGGGVSSLDGLLSATGSVYLINPNGVIIGRSGVVEVGGSFVASTLDTSDAGFLKGGALSFGGPSQAAVINYGRIGALGGDVALIAATVDNAGSITAADGDAGLLAGSSVLLRDASLDAGRFSVLLGGAGTRATNSGLIAAADAELRAEGGNVYALAGDTAGVIRATGVASGGGKVWLVAEGGSLEVAGTLQAQGPGGAAGAIETSGRSVALGSARIDAHGGTWLVDPQDLTIDATAASTLDAALNAGTSVVEQTTATGTSGAGVANPNGSGDIVVAAPLSWNTTAGLTLSAYRNVDVDAAVTLTGGGKLTLYADNAATGLGQASGTVNFGTGGAVTADSAATVDVYYNPLSYTDAATNSTLTLRPSYSGPTTYTNPYAAHVTGGTLSAYMLVDTLAQLGGGLTGVGSELDGLYALNADLDASSTATANPVPGMAGSYYGFVPIGFTGANSGGSSYGTDDFTGRFDGQGHTISNLYIDHFTLDANNNVEAVNYAGLFGYVNAGPGGAGSGGGIVHDLNLVNATVLASAGSNGPVIGMLDGGGQAYGLTASGTISGGYFTGGLIGTVYGTGAPYTVYDSHASTTVNGGEYLGGLFGQMYVSATADDVYATGSVGLGQANPASEVGGLVGSAAGGSLSNSYATGNVAGTDHVGGLAGQLDGTQTNVYATGSVTSTGAGDRRVGGLAGDAAGTITGAYATGAVSAQGDQVGGLIGDMDSNTTVTNSYATGAVTTQGNNVGGLIGYANPAYSVTDSFATGAVTTTGYSVGGLIGQSFAGVVGQAYASGAVSGTGNIGGLLGSTTDYGDNAAGLAISDSYATGSVTGTGTAANAATSYIGGLVGAEQHAEPTAGATTTITRTYATGLVSGQGVQGGLVGGNIGVISDSLWDRTSTGQASGVGATLASSTSNPPTTSVTNLTSVQDTDPTAADYAFSTTPYANAGFSFGNIPGGGGGETWVQVDTDGSFNGENGGIVGTRPFLLMEATPSISNAHQLQLLDLFQYEQNPAPYALIADIDAGGTARLSDMWGPAGFVPLTRVEADFDGQGHTVSGLTVNTSVLDGGLFDNILQDLTVQNLTLAGGSVTVTGADEQSAGALAGVNQGDIINVTSSMAVSGGAYVGGLAGQNLGTIAGSSASGTVRAQSTFGPQVGGLVGFNDGPVTASSASGAVTDLNATATPGSAVGGLFGSNLTTVSGLSASGAVTSLADADAGGLIGENSGAIDQSSATGAVRGAAYAGGLIGQSNGPNDATGLISNSFATGAVSGANFVGGLIGASAQSVAGAYATGKVTATWDEVGGLVGVQGQRQGFFGPTQVATSVTGSHASGEVTGGGQIGGLIGLAGMATSVASSYATGAVTGLGGDLPFGVGGLIGEADGATVTGSAALGAVSGQGAVGGLVGYAGTGRDANFNTLYTAVSDSYAAGAVTATDTAAGGLVGQNDSGSVIDSYATGSVSGVGSVGGLVGLNLELNASNTANASASNPLPSITGTSAGTTYASGRVKGAGDGVGGLVGVNQGTITNASYTGSLVSGASDVGGVVGLLPVVTYVDGNGDNAFVAASVTGVASTGAVTGSGSAIGGLVGLSTGGQVVDSYETGAVSGRNQVGGLVGANLNDTATNPGVTYVGTISGQAGAIAPTTFAVGAVTGTGTAAGGLVGENQGQVSYAVYTPNGADQVSGAAKVGGAVGLNDLGGVISNVAVTNPVSGTSYVGGLVGDNFGMLSNSGYGAYGVTGGLVAQSISGGGGTGGIVGVNESGGVVDGASVGGGLDEGLAVPVTVTGAGNDVGGIAGANFGSVMLASVVATTVSGVDHTGGLVGYNAGSVSGAGDGAVNGRDYTGGVVGLNFGTVSLTSAGLYGDQYIPAPSGLERVGGRNYVGGLVGWNDASGTVTAATTPAIVIATGDYVGGAVGVNKAVLSGLASAGGSVSGAGVVGGLVGLNQGTIRYSNAGVPVSGNLYVGGLVGWNDTGATVSRSYATGAVAGIAGGQEAGTNNDYVGGLAGVNFGAIADTYATGAVSGVQVVGGLVGTNMPGGASVATSYATGAVTASRGAVGSTFGVQAGEVSYVYGFPALSGQPVESGYVNAGSTGDGTDLTAAQEDGSAAYVGFDFTDIWQSNPDGPPTLKPPAT